ncbi:magnesium-dependent phosphatase 1 [Leptinotarsa decemlineata]|uniref:magnesium-dependent phosphatase 1 n=1 Tax=Leptinotarsa decemlineata TaxID=7539 RepID=UPI000C254B13|nr:magnesium-dependent phosphatase 1-like [Leptinotarsa decemlineata]
MGLEKLKLIVFDLDYTLWPFWVDTHVNPPFKKEPSGTITDSLGTKVTCYPQVPEVLKNLHEEGYILAVASRTSEIKGARQLIQLFGWDKYFKYKEIFPGKKVTHFNNIKSQSGLEFDEMIFFDDEMRNIHDINDLGVVSIFVEKGVSKAVIEEGKRQFSEKRK